MELINMKIVLSNKCQGKVGKNILQRPLEVWDICPNILGGLFCERPCIKKWKAIVSVAKNILLTKIQVPEKLNKID